jgi:hypothetical protein
MPRHSREKYFNGCICREYRAALRGKCCRLRGITEGHQKYTSHYDLSRRYIKTCCDTPVPVEYPGCTKDPSLKRRQSQGFGTERENSRLPNPLANLGNKKGRRLEQRVQLPNTIKILDVNPRAQVAHVTEFQRRNIGEH